MFEGHGGLIVFLTYLQLALSQECESGEVTAMVQLQRQALSTTAAQTPVPITDVISNPPGATIPDAVWTGPPPDNTGALCKSFKVAGVADASSMSVQVKINHDFVGDVVIWIEGPTGTFSVLKDGPSSPTEFRFLRADFPLTFITTASKAQSDIANTAVMDNVACKAAPAECSFRPANPNNHAGSVNLDTLAADPNGNWKLCVADDDAGTEGELVDFKLYIPAYDPLNPPTDGGVQGDPHVHSLRGAHYTLLKEGIFTAWNFTKSTTTEKVNWQLLAAYLGRQFTIQGLLLMNKNSGETMEIMAQDCAWRVKHHDAWSKASDVQAELKKSAKDGATNFDIKDVKEKLGNSATFKSTLVMNMRSQDAMQEVAKLVVHCKPQHHLDFKVKMSHTDDIKHVGGELGVGPDANSNYLFLFSKQGVRDMKTDREFKASGTWVTLGGRPETDKYFKSKQSAGVALLQTSCTEAQEKNAKTMCAKYLEAARHPDVFADCVYDVCRGGGETFAQNAAAFITMQ